MRDGAGLVSTFSLPSNLILSLVGLASRSPEDEELRFRALALGPGNRRSPTTCLRFLLSLHSESARWGGNASKFFTGDAGGERGPPNGIVPVWREGPETGGRHRTGLDREFFRGIIAYIDSLHNSRRGQFDSRTSSAKQQDSSIENEGPSCDVIENT